MSARKRCASTHDDSCGTTEVNPNEVAHYSQPYGLEVLIIFASNEHTTTAASNEHTTTAATKEHTTTAASNEHATTAASNEHATTAATKEHATTAPAAAAARCNTQQQGCASVLHGVTHSSSSSSSSSSRTVRQCCTV
ncbi:hypothetical protein FHG87_004728 [Trinorchestia longiramus]|nr:hypothetical protein FHG87_004728 [Trinorchestia longiramus]